MLYIKATNPYTDTNPYTPVGAQQLGVHYVKVVGYTKNAWKVVLPYRKTASENYVIWIARDKNVGNIEDDNKTWSVLIGDSKIANIKKAPAA